MTASTVALKFDKSDLEKVIQQIQQALASAGMTVSQKLNEFIQLTRQLLGDRPTLQDVINNDWNNATLAVTGAETQLKMVLDREGWWGGSADAFERWAIRQMTAVTTWKNHAWRGHRFHRRATGRLECGR